MPSAPKRAKEATATGEQSNDKVEEGLVLKQPLPGIDSNNSLV